MSVSQPLFSLVLAVFLQTGLSVHAWAQQVAGPDCEVPDQRAFELEKSEFYSFFCDGRSNFKVAVNDTRSASGSTTEQMVRFSRIVRKLKNGRSISENEAEFLANTIKRDEQILSIFAAITTTRLFASSKEMICRKEFANEQEQLETNRLRAEVERTIACGARF